MNLLAHQVLSGNNESIQLGNLLGEIIKGKRYTNFPEEIAQGILLHRQIDTFTDQHEIVRQSTARLHKQYGKFSPIIIDVFYDYFLIKNWDLYNFGNLDTFINNCYLLFNQKKNVFPTDFKKIVWYMIEYDWFRNYGTLEGVHKTLEGLSKRSKFANNMAFASKELLLYEDEFNQEFLMFFDEIQSFVTHYLSTLQKT